MFSLQEHEEEIPCHEVHLISEHRLQQMDTGEDGAGKQYEGVPWYRGGDAKVSNDSLSLIIVFCNVMSCSLVAPVSH